ncbi:fumarylacetoacetate hydrolase family protein [Phytohabitans sp. ZYX-F-186]|uniref:Fumarylacetoacetate hydrolase family protein n=1 Tax=Phytohabitans maris TaxID=3071409 RepID=A0ABU0ZC72_9ACTN|nr:fumarylacetoacetate hydrolase family protein [Phytohabitans sp. ZYX-F-186]MDQ7904645.1 fumarylacetoacetate hydrolase family protein [Phytohabitans sp. ZYX-F-186]
MRLVNDSGRLALVVGDRVADVKQASKGRFSPDPDAVFPRWTEFREWAATVTSGTKPLADVNLKAPVPQPRQLFAVGLNYRAHAEETDTATPDEPLVFAKFPSCLTGPDADITVAGRSIDWEAELVVVMAVGGRGIPAERAWDCVAGLTVGQDLSERVDQARGPVPQWSMAKSHEKFGPTGPTLVTPDEVDNPAKLEIRCTIGGEVVQQGNTAQMIHPVPQLIEWISHRVKLFPGDLIFTGTPAGVGMGRNPPRYLCPGDVLVTEIGGLGRIEQRFR